MKTIKLKKMGSPLSQTELKSVVGGEYNHLTAECYLHDSEGNTIASRIVTILQSGQSFPVSDQWDRDCDNLCRSTSGCVEGTVSFNATGIV